MTKTREKRRRRKRRGRHEDNMASNKEMPVFTAFATFVWSFVLFSYPWLC